MPVQRNRVRAVAWSVKTKVVVCTVVQTYSRKCRGEGLTGSHTSPIECKKGREIEFSGSCLTASDQDRAIAEKCCGPTVKRSHASRQSKKFPCKVKKFPGRSQ